MVFAFLPVVFHRETMGRAAFGAHAADHTFFSINGPGAILPVNGNRLSGAVMFTPSAEEALVDGIFHVKRIVRLWHVRFAFFFYRSSRNGFFRWFYLFFYLGF